MHSQKSPIIKNPNTNQSIERPTQTSPKQNREQSKLCLFQWCECPEEPCQAPREILRKILLLRKIFFRVCLGLERERERDGGEKLSNDPIKEDSKYTQKLDIHRTTKHNFEEIRANMLLFGVSRSINLLANMFIYWKTSTIHTIIINIS